MSERTDIPDDWPLPGDFTVLWSSRVRKVVVPYDTEEQARRAAMAKFNGHKRHYDTSSNANEDCANV